MKCYIFSRSKFHPIPLPAEQVKLSLVPVSPQLEISLPCLPVHRRSLIYLTATVTLIRLPLRSPHRPHYLARLPLLYHLHNNNNNHNNVYGAIIMTKVIARVHPVHLMNADWAPGGRQPSDQPKRLGLWVRRKLAATIHIHNCHCYYYLAHKLILILPSHEGWKAEST